MRKVSDAYKAANVAPVRRTQVRLLSVSPEGAPLECAPSQITAVEARTRFDPGNVTLPVSACLVTTLGAESFVWQRRGAAGAGQRQRFRFEIGLDVPGSGMVWGSKGIWWMDPDNSFEDNGPGAEQQLRLVDVWGLIDNRRFQVPDQLPTTLEGWLTASLATVGLTLPQAGVHVADSVGIKPVTAVKREDVEGQTAGNIVSSACMAAGVSLYPRDDLGGYQVDVLPETGTAGHLTLGNLDRCPCVRAGTQVSDISFTLYGSDGKKTDTMIGGTSTDGESISIRNPFIHTSAQAMEVANHIIHFRGGQVIEAAGRGDPASELGDFDTVELGGGREIRSMRVAQSYSHVGGALQGCKSEFLQPTRILEYKTWQLLTVSGYFEVPDGVTRLKLALGQGGQSGVHGQAGWESGKSNLYYNPEGHDGKPGAAGLGGLVWIGYLDVTPHERIAYHIGAGGVANETWAEDAQGAWGEHTTFGPCSSKDGKRWSPSYVDSTTGKVFAQDGQINNSINGWPTPEPPPPHKEAFVPTPPPANSGNGGDGGAGGSQPYFEQRGTDDYGRPHWVKIQRAGPGTVGADGATGFALVFWDAPAS